MRLEPSASRKSNFACSVSGACGKQAAQIGAGGQQNQPRQQHQSRKKCPHCGSKKVAMEPRMHQAEAGLVILFGIGRLCR